MEQKKRGKLEALVVLVAIVGMWMLVLGPRERRAMAPVTPVPPTMDLVPAEVSSNPHVKIVRAKPHASTAKVVIGPQASSQLPTESRGEARPPSDMKAGFAELGPLFIECFHLGLQENPDMMEADVLLTLQIAADDFRGVVEKVSVAESGTDLPPSFAECMRETTYRLKVSAPEGTGESVGIIWPIRFAAPGEAPGEQAPSAAL